MPYFLILSRMTPVENKTMLWLKPVVIALWLMISISLLSCTTNSSRNSELGKINEPIKLTPSEWAASVDNEQIQQARNVDWLESFNDPTLKKLVHEALLNNRSLSIAAKNVDRAKALAVQAGAQLKPQADLVLSSSRSGSPSDSLATVTNQSLSAQVTWEVDLWGRISAGQQAAALSVEAAAADYKYAQHSLAAATAQAYFVAIEADQQTTVLMDMVGLLEKTLKITNVQYENGLTSKQDVSIVKTDLANAREQLIALEASKKDALRSLEVLLGRYPRGDVGTSKTFSDLPAMPSPGLPSDILERRPDLIASERRIAAAFNAVQQAQAARLPRLSLTSNIGGSSSSLADISSPANVTWQLASNLLAPLFDGGTRKAQVKIATIEQQLSVDQYVQSALNAFKEVESNLGLATSLMQRKSALDTALEESDKAYKIAQIRYDEGESPLLDVLSIQQRMLNARSNNIYLQRLLLEQRLNLFLALGGDWEL